jgi:hypothetical protein
MAKKKILIDRVSRELEKIWTLLEQAEVILCCMEEKLKELNNDRQTKK